MDKHTEAVWSGYKILYIHENGMGIFVIIDLSCTQLEMS